MKKGFTLIELIAVIIILGVIALIIAPIVNETIEKSKVKAFTESLKNIIKSAQIYQANNNFANLPAGGIDVTGEVIQFQNSKTIVSGRIIETEGLIYLVNVSDGTYCGNGPVDALVIVEGDCPVTNTCYTFDAASGTILSYNKETCPLNVVIPDLIDGVQVRNIGFGAFVEKTAVHCTTDDWYSESNEGPNYVPVGAEICYFDATAGQNALTSVTLPRYLENVGPGAFAGWDNANNITTVDFSRAVDLVGISYDSFSNNELDELDLDGLVNLDTIGDYAFCDNNFDFAYTDPVILPLDFASGRLPMLQEAFCTNYWN